MNGFAALGILLGLVAVVTAAGVAWRATTGRARRTRGTGEALRPGDIGVETFGPRATLLQFSTDFCAPCRSTARVLGSAADDLDGVHHVEVDLTSQPELASRFRILQTPTTLLLDASGRVRARIGGPVRPDTVRATLDTILRSDHASA